MLLYLSYDNLMSIEKDFKPIVPYKTSLVKLIWIILNFLTGLLVLKVIATSTLLYLSNSRRISPSLNGRWESEGNSRNNFLMYPFFSFVSCGLICGQVLTHVLRWELLTCTRAAYFCMPVCQKASATEILTFYNCFNQLQNNRPVESLELLFNWLTFSSYWLTDLRKGAS